MSIANYGEVWRTQPEGFWDWMWQTRAGEPITEHLLDRCLEADTIIEIGCGYGHFCKELLRRGWKGSSYTGFDISDGPLSFDQLQPNIRAIRGDFMQACASEPRVDVDLVISQAVLCHQSHWMPMFLAALLRGREVAMDVSYLTDEPLHNPVRRNDGCYDTRTSPAQLQEELAAVGLDQLVRVERHRNTARGVDELLLTGGLDARWPAP